MQYLSYSLYLFHANILLLPFIKLDISIRDDRVTGVPQPNFGLHATWACGMVTRQDLIVLFQAKN